MKQSMKHSNLNLKKRQKMRRKIRLYVKDGNPLIVTKYEDKKTGRMRGKAGRIIWDGKNFIFVPEKVTL